MKIVSWFGLALTVAAGLAGCGSGSSSTTCTSGQTSLNNTCYSNCTQLNGQPGVQNGSSCVASSAITSGTGNCSVMPNGQPIPAPYTGTISTQNPSECCLSYNGQIYYNECWYNNTGSYGSTQCPGGYIWNGYQCVP